MQVYSQKWYDDRLGTCNTTIAQSGCFITCLAMFSGIEPPEVNQLLIRKGGYQRGCLVISGEAADILGLDYEGIKHSNPGNTCIAETDHYKDSGYKQHFFVYANGLIIDPLDTEPKWKNNPYNIVSYRLFKPKEKVMNIKDEKLRKFYEDKRKAQGWSSLEDWVGAAKEYRDERDTEKKALGKVRENYESKIARLEREVKDAEDSEEKLVKELREIKEEKFELFDKLEKLKKVEEKLQDKIKVANVLRKENKKLRKKLSNAEAVADQKTKGMSVSTAIKTLFKALLNKLE